jgi:hypothetical protein
MTPKEKAEELFTTYRFSLSIPNAPLGDLKDIIAKQFALIAVNEILSDYKNYLLHENTEYKGLMYWKEVKKELEKL